MRTPTLKTFGLTFTVFIAALTSSLISLAKSGDTELSKIAGYRQWTRVPEPRISFDSSAGG